MSKAPTRLHFDDGSRIITENVVTPISTTTTANHVIPTTSTPSSSQTQNPRGSTPIQTHYEINKIASQIVNEIIIMVQSKNDENNNNYNDDGFLCKVALQFPDELLNDAAQVSWLIEDAILKQYQTKIQNQNNIDTTTTTTNTAIPLVFVLGDTTYSSCCPDEIGALHLNADVIVHYGQYACLSPSQCLPVLYSFGCLDCWVGKEQCINSIQQYLQHSEDDTTTSNDTEKEVTRKMMLLCERRYHQYMNELAIELRKNDKVQEVIIGTIPKNNDLKRKVVDSLSKRLSCCGNNDTCCDNTNDCTKNEHEENVINNQTSIDDDGIIIGGLKVSINPSTLSQYTLLYIGDDSGDSKSRQFLNTILRCTSPTNGTKECWSYNPDTNQLSNDPYSTIGVAKYLNRRFYLTQKAQLASIMGILVGTLSQDRFRNVISSVRRKIEDSGRGCYTFVVGKINVAKLANFAEIECFVLISCEETSVLKDEREFHIPVITLSELDIVLGDKVWNGSDSCNADFNDFLKGDDAALKSTVDGQTKNIDLNDDEDDDEGEDGDGDNDDSDDEPFFSMITGTYVSKPTSERTSGGSDLTGRENESSQIVEYKSKAAEFLKSREYRGLEANIGKTEIKAATEGQCGIASDYGK